MGNLPVYDKNKWYHRVEGVENRRHDILQQGGVCRCAIRTPYFANADAIRSIKIEFVIKQMKTEKERIGDVQSRAGRKFNAGGGSSGCSIYIFHEYRTSGGTVSFP